MTWHKNRNKWYVQLRVKGEKQKYGGMFKDELDGARRVNQLCQEFGMPLQNPTISGIPNQRYQVTKKFVGSYQTLSLKIPLKNNPSCFPRNGKKIFGFSQKRPFFFLYGF